MVVFEPVMQQCNLETSGVVTSFLPARYVSGLVMCTVSSGDGLVPAQSIGRDKMQVQEPSFTGTD